MVKKAVGLRLEEDLLGRVDSARGDVPRNRWIERALEAALGTSVGDPEVGRVSRHPVPASPRASDTLRPPGVRYKCPMGHPFNSPPTSPSARCGACGRQVVEA